MSSESLPQLAVDASIYHLQEKGGISRIYNEILPRMCMQDPSLHIALYTSSPLLQPLPAHPHIRRINLSRHDLRPSRLWKYPRFFYDRIQYSHTLSPSSIWHSTYFTLPPHKVRATSVTVYDMIYYRFSNLFSSVWDERFRKQQKLCLESADQIICISQASADDVGQFCYGSSQRIRVVPLACSSVFMHLERDAINSERVSARPFMLYAGKRYAYKNFRMLLKSYASWSKRNDIDLIVVGPSWSVDEMQQIKNFGIESTVHLIANADDNLLCQLYNLAVAFVYPSLWEGFGIPILEAMACGCPIVASRIPSTVEIAAEYPFYFDPYDMESLHAALDDALTESRDSLRIRNAINHTAEYSWDKTTALTLDTFRSL